MKRVLFTGYAPVHFVCFRPIYERLRRLPGVDVFVSGGQEAGGADGQAPLSARELYRAFRIPGRQVLSLEAMRRQRFDMVFCAHVSGYFPREDKERVQILHGLSFRNMAVRRDVLVFDHLFITGPYRGRAFLEQQLLRPGDPRLVPIGFPKVDRLVDGTLDRGAILRRLGLAGRRPVLLYAPTGQKGNSLETLGEEVIRRLRASNRYDILIKLHDHPRDKTVDWASRLKPLLDRHTKLVRDFDIVPYLFAADLLVSDASSVSSEYSLLDRPMVFLDVPDMIAAMKAKGRAVDLETWGRNAGVTVRWPDEAVDAVRESLAHPRRGSELRRAMARDLFYNPGRAAETALAWIRERLGRA
jgi:hypothetical protein